MRKTKSLSITLPHDMAQLVKDKVASGDYATESEVVREGLRALRLQDAALEQWLRTEGVARYDAYHRGEGAGRPASEVFARLRARAVTKGRAGKHGKANR
ncbi:MAG: type II toxin-antitoxin system ParD family antitoxin, partial [Xanthobacteraceae bacterium]